MIVVDSFCQNKYKAEEDCIRMSAGKKQTSTSAEINTLSELDKSIYMKLFKTKLR